MPTDDEIEALATATLPSRRLQLRRDDDGLTISVVLTAVDVVEDPGREISAAAAVDFDASPGDELTVPLWSPSAIESAGWSAVMEAAEDRDPSPAGGVFYHDQDLEGALEGRALHLAFGALADPAARSSTTVELLTLRYPTYAAALATHP